MTRHFCDRCGLECKSLITIKLPFKNNGHGSYSTEEMQVCKTCNELHAAILESLTDIKITMYRNLFYGGVIHNEHK